PIAQLGGEALEIVPALEADTADRLAPEHDRERRRGKGSAFAGANPAPCILARVGKRETVAEPYPDVAIIPVPDEGLFVRWLPGPEDEAFGFDLHEENLRG